MRKQEERQKKEEGRKLHAKENAKSDRGDEKNGKETTSIVEKFESTAGVSSLVGLSDQHNKTMPAAG